MTYARYRTLFPLLCLSFLTGCTLDNLQLPFFPGEHHANADQLAEYFHHISNLPLEQLIREYETAKLVYDNHKNYTNTLRYVLFLILPNPELNDTRQAEHLLASMLRSNKNENKSLENISILLIYLVKEINRDEMLHEYHNARLMGEIEKNKKQLLIYRKLNEKLRDTVRKKAQQDVYYQKLNQELQEKRETIEALQKKIEELKTIERNLNQRRNTKSPTT